MGLRFSRYDRFEKRINGNVLAYCFFNTPFAPRLKAVATKNEMQCKNADLIKEEGIKQGE